MKNNIIKGKPLNFNVGIQRWYVKELLKLVDDLTKEVYEELKPLYKEYKEQITFTQDASISSQSRIKIKSLRDLFEKKFKDRGKTFAERMVRKTNRYANTSFWGMMN
jgi:FKBP-type peptidyl-prolyl cis-trans isomerase (trigger factor)